MERSMSWNPSLPPGYHDQGQIALKLLGFDRGVTVAEGRPFVLTTPAHGTAFDIAGQGVADIGPYGPLSVSTSCPARSLH